VVNALAFGQKGPGFAFPALPLFYCVASVVKLFTHIASPVFSTPRNCRVQKGVFGLDQFNGLTIKCIRFS